MGLRLRLLGRLEEALAQLTLALELYPSPATSWLGAGEFMVGHYANWIQERRGISPWVV